MAADSDRRANVGLVVSGRAERITEKCTITVRLEPTSVFPLRCEPMHGPEGRYRVDRPLGRGGMGAVYLTHDALLDRLVALKRAHRYRAADLLRFKREFRVIEGLVHPNLVRLYELGADDDGLYYTMEAIDGADLVTHCAGDPGARLRAALPQLVAALSFLHAHGIVHCDLKPTNVLVDRAGTVKLLDFGVLAELSRSAHEGVAGTPDYMAPEVIRGEPASPATDAYALGCTMFEVLVGRTPFTGSIPEVLAAHLHGPAPRPAEHATGLPPDLDALAHALLAKDADERPTSGALAEQLANAPAPRRAPAVAALLGREDLQGQLTRALTGSQRPLVLAGPSGVGKSALLEWLARDAEARGWVVFRGASRSTERLPYNAFDAAMDDLAREIMRGGEVRVDACARRVAAEAFPTLSASSRNVDRARERVRQRLFGWREELDGCTRREVFDAVATLFDAVAKARGGLVVIDDAQWADADSLALLWHLLERTGPSLRIALAVRTDVAINVPHPLFARGGCRVEVPPLEEADMIALLRRTAESLGASASDDALREAARACEGRPFLAEVAGRALARGARGTVLDLVDAAWRREGDALALLVAADGWTPLEMLASVLGRPLGEVDDAMRGLAAEGVIRRSGGSYDGVVDLYHDGVRAAALARIGVPERTSLHGRIADHLLAVDGAPSQEIVRHLLGAGREREAAVHARAAAAAAERQRAFSLAADMYAVALTRAPEDRAVREARAWALERSSRYTEAAGEWATLARGASGDALLDLSLHEAHALLAASRTREGIRRLDSALAESGHGPVHVRGLRAIDTVSRFLIGPIRARRTKARDPGLRKRAERNLKIGILLAFVEPLTGMRFLQRARADFLRAGAEAQVAGCDYMFAILAYAGSRDRERVPLAERYLEGASRRARGLELPPDVRGMSDFVRGVREMRRGGWRDARAAFETAAEIFRESTGTTEVTMARSWLMMMAAHMQDMDEARRHRDWFLHHADDCGGTLFLVHIALVDGYIRMLEGRFDEGFDTVTRGAEHFDDDPPNAQRAALLVYRYGARVYASDPIRARRELTEMRERTRRFRFMSTMYAGTYGVLFALIEANALRAGDREASARRIEAWSRVIDRSPPLWAGGARRARAYAADALGRREEALEQLRVAEREAARYERRVDVAIARWQRGRRIGGDEGAALCREARDIVAALAVSPLVLEEDAGLR